jgi:hypothetical protein
MESARFDHVETWIRSDVTTLPYLVLIADGRIVDGRTVLMAFAGTRPLFSRPVAIARTLATRPPSTCYDPMLSFIMPITADPFAFCPCAHCEATTVLKMMASSPCCQQTLTGIGLA